MDKEDTIEFLVDKLDSTYPIAEALYTLVVDKNVNPTRLRNAMIIKDFDLMTDPIMDRYSLLAEKYSSSWMTVRTVIKERKFNEI